MKSEKADEDLPPTDIPKRPVGPKFGRRCRPLRCTANGMTTITKDIQSIAAETGDFRAAAVKYLKNVIRVCEQALAEIEGEEPLDGGPEGK